MVFAPTRIKKRVVPDASASKTIVLILLIYFLNKCDRFVKRLLFRTNSWKNTSIK